MLARIALVASLFAASALTAQTTSTAPAEGHPAAGFSGLWWTPKQGDLAPCRGACATFSPYHAPIARYSKEAGKTFFVYGASGRVPRGAPVHQIAISWFDHKTGMVHRPTILLDSPNRPAAGNPALAIDAAGYLWVFVSGANGMSGEVYRSSRPYDIGAFERLAGAKFEFPQPWRLPGGGFLVLSIDPNGKLAFSSSDDGRSWATAKPLTGARTLAISGQAGSRLGVAVASAGKGSAAGVGYLETSDGGKSWTTIDKKPVALPLPADLGATHLPGATGGAFLKDIVFDARGNPLVLYLAEARVGSGRWVWMIAYWNGREWETSGLIESEDPGDSGALYAEPQGVWHLIAPTAPGHDRGPGGDMVSWASDDQGRSWRRKPLTSASPVNHNWVRRPVGAQPDFYALWSAGSLYGRGNVDLYFCTQEGQVFRLPREMAADTARPELVSTTTTSKKE